MKPKLIIFDMDDCLVDTWGALMPSLLKNSLKAMIAAGLNIEFFDEALENFTKINNKSKSGGEAIERFLNEIGADSSFLEAGKKGFYDFDFDYQIEALPGVKEILEQANAYFALVTKGKLGSHMDKLAKAGIDEKIFKKIMVVSDYNKGEYYQQILEELGYSSEDCFVCGDRYETDLIPAKKLGMKTVYTPRGRGKLFPPKEGDVDFVINDFRELIPVVNWEVKNG